jgi:hypothetical protein
VCDFRHRRDFDRRAASSLRLDGGLRGGLFFLDGGALDEVRFFASTCSAPDRCALPA